ncbi:MAG: proteasome assembly chaperone family protein, partial [Methanomicrobiales archaeon]|nr:proteasome assembly chaperone family protein [Methanomicrobiales archaeon]
MIEDISVRYLDRFSKKPLNDPVFIEGLPGIGQVGKLVAEYMIHVLGAEKIAEINSLYFPPQVMLDETGTVRLARNELYLYQSEKRDLVFLVGDHQSASGEGHYILADCYCDLA